MSETASEPNDFVRLIGQLTNFVENERVRAYNEGVDAERERCARIAGALYKDKGDVVARAIRDAEHG